MSLYYAIKRVDIGFLRHVMREVCIILQASSASKLNYSRKMIRQVYIFDTKVADHILWKAYLTNFLVNSQGLYNFFYETDLLLEYQNSNFKQFCNDRWFLLQESDETFSLYTFIVDIVKKIKI